MKIWPFSRKSGTPYSAANLSALMAAAFGGGGSTKSGATVTAKNSLEVTVVLACVRVIAEGVAQVPFRVMQESPDGKIRLPAKKHPLYRVLNKKPNKWQTSFGLRESMIIHAALSGNGYSYISRVGSDRRIAELIFIPSDRCKPEFSDNGTAVYVVTGKDGSRRVVSSDDMWHLRGPSWDGLVGMSIINLAREAIGLAMSSEETQSKLHANGVKSSGTYSVDAVLNPEQYEKLNTWIKAQFSGANAGNAMVLDRGAKWFPNSMSGIDAQHLETRINQCIEICRAFRVMPIMVGQSDKAATYASAEQMFIAHLVHTLTPWYERFEQSADCQLLTDRELDQGYYTFLDPTGMLRGALKDTAEYLYKLISIGTMTRNEGREKLDLNSIEGLDEPLTPMNMITSATNDQQEPANGN